MTKTISFKLLDFQIYNEEVYNEEEEISSEEEYQEIKDKREFMIQVYGLNEKGETYSVIINDFEPFFYIKVGNDWDTRKKNIFLRDIKKELKKYYWESITQCSLVKREDLYGFDNGKRYNFILMKFKNTIVMNKIKNLFYKNIEVNGKKERKLRDTGYIYKNESLRLYEANLPPLLRYFHIQNISPSGWVEIANDKLLEHTKLVTNCDYEYTTGYKNVKAQNKKEENVPYKICSFDIEASSSHGDFPVAKKTYKKLTTNILDYWMNNEEILNETNKKSILKTLIITAFGYGETIDEIDLVYPKKELKKENLLKRVEIILKRKIKELIKSERKNENSIREFLDMDIEEEDEEENEMKDKKDYNVSETHRDQYTILDILEHKKISREEKLIEITNVFDELLPPLKGDIVTFIGSTFLKYGEKEPYLNHCIALNSCDKVDGAQIETYETEKDVLLAWTELIQKENPDIIIGYNIFGFDYKFMFERAQENGEECVKKFLKLSRNKEEICGRLDEKHNYKIEETSLTIASGTHDLYYIKMNGRVQIDMYNYFRREYNLTSYKLDYASGYFISDKVKKIEYNGIRKDETTKVFSKNLTGLKKDSYIHFEEIGHSSEYYKDGAKFKVIDVNEKEGSFIVEGKQSPDMTKVVKWCLAKDDVTPQDIFRMTNEGPKERAVIAKYCIQDCNLVHHLLRKIDVITGLVEMAKICSVPLDFLIMRGQGIKLFSFIAKKCREAKTLIPVLEKKDDGGYEGAIVLDPKCGLYLDEPVACVDYSSLYPSSMISENISHDSKVWTKEYDLDGNLIKETGIKDSSGNYVYDNLPNFKYVDVNYDTFEYIRKTEKSAAVKTKVGSKTCRFAQFPNGKLAIMPRILKELLAARKATRASAKWKTITTSIGKYTGLILEKNETHITLKDKQGDIKIIECESIQEMEDTYDDFMKNVLDKRQLAIKVTANSLYGQCGAKTSSFYEKDVAASTTATGRKLLTYGKRIIEEVYGDRICETPYGKVHSHAEYIYGDSVLGDTPIILRDKYSGNIITKNIMDLSNEWEIYEEFKPYDTFSSNRKDKQQSKIKEYEVWTKNGWSDIKRVIRHKCNKRIYRVVTHNSVVDVTEDHSLLDMNGEKVKPNECYIGKELLENNIFNNIEKNILTFENIKNYIDTDMSIEEKKAFIYGFFMGDGCCGKYETNYGIKYSWELNNSNIVWCDKLKIILEEIYNKKFKILDTLKSSGVYKIVPNCSNIEFLTNEFMCMYENKCKIVPEIIQNGNNKNKQAFLCGYYLADGNNSINETSSVIRFDCKNKLTASSFVLLVSSLGYNVSMNTRNDKDVYRITCTKNKLRKETNLIKNIFIKLERYNDFVYDIETEDGTFNTGFPLIIKNTDSVFMSFKLTDPNTGEKIVGKEALKHTIELAKEAGELATKFLKAPHDLEYEKTFMPFCLLSKKRYVGMLYEEDPDKCYRKSMGIVLKRRDNAPIVKDVYGGIIDILMKDRDVNKAIQYTKRCMDDIVNEKYSMDKLIITKSLRAFYKNPLQIAHKVLADRMGKRDPGNKPSSGDRIPFVYIQTKKKVKLQGDKVEHPDYIRENKLKPDYAHYITNQIMKPVQQVFALVLEDIPAYKNKKLELKMQIKRIKKKYKDDMKKQHEYEMKLRNKEVKKLIFDEALTKCMNAKNNQRDLMSFFQ